MSEASLFLAQRAAAAVMLPFVAVHLGIILYAVHEGLSAATLLGRTQGSVVWGLFYGLFVLAVAVHGAIGLRAVAREIGGGFIGKRRFADAVGLLFLVTALVLGWRAVGAVTL